MTVLCQYLEINVEPGLNPLRVSQQQQEEQGDLSFCFCAAGVHPRNHPSHIRIILAANLKVTFPENSAPPLLVPLFVRSLWFFSFDFYLNFLKTTG